MYKLTAETGNEPLTLTEIKAHLRVDHDEEDALIMLYAKAAREKVEAYTGRKLVKATYTMQLDDLEGDIYLFPNPVISVEQITYYDSNDAQATLSSGVYTFDNYNTPAFIYERTNQDYPGTNGERNNVAINYTVGYENAEDVPSNAKAAILFITGFLYENRQAVSTLQSYEVPLGIKFLLDPLKIIQI
jgi:uncharacterized phiE125 gp8 family phage protein